MKTNNKALIKDLVELQVLKTEPLKDQVSSNITITYSNGETRRIITDNISDEDLPILIQTKQLKTLKSINSMVLFHTILTIVGLFAAACILYFFQ